MPKANKRTNLLLATSLGFLGSLALALTLLGGGFVLVRVVLLPLLQLSSVALLVGSSLLLVLGLLGIGELGPLLTNQSKELGLLLVRVLRGRERESETKKMGKMEVRRNSLLELSSLLLLEEEIGCGSALGLAGTRGRGGLLRSCETKRNALW